MILSDGEIWEALRGGDLGIEPEPSPDFVKPSSVDLRLDRKLWVHRREPIRGVILDVSEDDFDVMDHVTRYTEPIDLVNDGPYELAPQAFVIGQTLERVSLPKDIAARVEGRSSLARLGLGVHITAPKIDPGFRGQITLEFFNFGPHTLRLTYEARICTLILERLGRPAQSGYAGRYGDRSTSS